MPHTLPVSCALRSAFLPVPAMSAAASPHVSDEEADDITADGAQQLIDQFVDVTDSNDALAQMFLQKRKWKLLPAINDYFEQISNPPAAAAVPNRSLSPAQLVDLTTDSDGEADDEDSSPVCKKAKTEPTKAVTAGGSTAGSESQPVPTPSSRKELIFVTWNKDGISEKNLTIRTEGVIKIVKQIQPDVMFLQEVVPQSESILRNQLKEYTIFSGRMWNGFPAQYYTMTLIRKEAAAVISNRVVDFESSVMTRNVIVTKVNCNGIILNLLNTHLESTKDFASHRMRQLLRMRDLVKEMPPTEPVILAGDLNMRDKELAESGGLPEGWIDVWEATGKRPECRYTWDTMRNDNLDTNFGKFKPRCRFDRVLVRDSKPSKLIPKTFSLIGLERLKPHVCFPSDHWGILTVFNTFGVSVTGSDEGPAVRPADPNSPSKAAN